ncbi:MAG TPA: hypothetical protein VMZ92_07785 [Planctomycetota bacterium]|nr:hypothetical protein [Planctomycetota bacterium]
MTEAEIILLMVKTLPVLLAVWIFCHLLSDEYLRALEARGLIRRRKPTGTVETEAAEGEEAADGK